MNVAYADSVETGRQTQWHSIEIHVYFSNVPNWHSVSVAWNLWKRQTHLLQYSSCHTYTHRGRRMNDRTAENVHIVIRIMFNFIALPNVCLCISLLIYICIVWLRSSKRWRVYYMHYVLIIQYAHKHVSTMQEGKSE